MNKISVVLWLVVILAIQTSAISPLALAQNKPNKQPLFNIRMVEDYYFGPKLKGIRPYSWSEGAGERGTLVGLLNSYPQTRFVHKPFKKLSWIAAGTVYRVLDVVPTVERAGMQHAKLKLTKLDGKEPNFEMSVVFGKSFGPVRDLRAEILSEIKKASKRNTFAPAFRIISEKRTRNANRELGDITPLSAPRQIKSLVGSKIRFKEPAKTLGLFNSIVSVNLKQEKGKEFQILGGQIFKVVHYELGKGKKLLLSLADRSGNKVRNIELVIDTVAIPLPLDPTKLKSIDKKIAVERVLRFINRGGFRFHHYIIDFLP